jgi:hypothetical protein
MDSAAANRATGFGRPNLYWAPRPKLSLTCNRVSSMGGMGFALAANATNCLKFSPETSINPPELAAFSQVSFPKSALIFPIHPIASAKSFAAPAAGSMKIKFPPRSSKTEDFILYRYIWHSQHSCQRCDWYGGHGRFLASLDHSDRTWRPVLGHGFCGHQCHSDNRSRGRRGHF